jgi:MFS family permease
MAGSGITIDNPNMRAKPRLSFWQIWNMSFGFLGIQFGFALQNGNMSRIFETMGAQEDKLAFLWIAAPTTGLLVQPIIGYLSDRTWSPRWGRRRPFLLVGAIFASLALTIMPHGRLWFSDLFHWHRSRGGVAAALHLHQLFPLLQCGARRPNCAFAKVCFLYRRPRVLLGRGLDGVHHQGISAGGPGRI